MSQPTFVSSFTPGEGPVARNRKPHAATDPPAAPAAAPAAAPDRVPVRAIAVPCLPQGLPADEMRKRADEVAENQALYQYQSPPTIPGVAFIKGPVDALPGQSPTFWWTLKAGLAGAKVLLNFAGWNPLKIFDALGTVWDSIFVNQNNSSELDAAIAKFRNKANSQMLADKVMKRFRNARLEGGQFEERNPILEPYRDMYTVLEQPEVGNVFLEDRVFNRLRIAGFNPMSLFRVRSMDELPFAVDDSRLPNEGDSVAAAISQNRVYALDYSFLAGVEQQRNSDKICVVTKGLFVVPPGGGVLQSVAIELEGEVVYPPRPSDPPSTRWAIAKMALNNDDAIHHELIAHLGKTHLLVEPFVAATMRQLPSSHPLHALLKPHFEGTVFINDRASNNLVAPGGDVDRIFAGEIDSVMRWCAEQVVNNKFNSSMPAEEMKLRGVDDAILYFPYREDALEHFDALYEWVLAYLSYYYKSDEDIVQDLELQAWVAELVDPNRGRVLEFGDKGDGKVRSVAYLARAVAFVIFSGSVQHAAVNFPQLALMSYAPAIAGGLWAKPPKADEEADINRWAAMLTPIQTAIEQVQILAVIGAVYYTKLGEYRGGEMPKEREVQEALKAYKGRLKAIDKRIAEREKNNDLKYDYLRPRNIPQSINI